MPTVLACLRRSVERMWPPRVPTRFGPGTRLRRPKNQWNQGPLATPQAEMCPRTANSGLRKPAHRIGFLVSCAYFGTAKRFFAPEDYHARDIRHAAHRLELPAT